MPQGLSDSRWVLDLPYVKPLLSANRKVHYQQQARVTKQIINDVRWLVKAARIPALGRCRVQLFWEPTAPARRDTDNLAPFLKPIYDSLTLEGLVADDAPAFMEKPESVILPWSRRDTFPLRRVMWLVIERLPMFASGGHLPAGLSVVTNTSRVAVRLLPVDEAGGQL